QRLTDLTIRKFIEHDDRIDAIHLFLRPRGNRPYIYCGALGYLVHDADREQPVHFQWQPMDWPPPGAVLDQLGVQPAAAGPPSAPAIAAPAAAGELTEVPRPHVARRGDRPTGQFITTKQPIHPDQSARNAAFGLAGEKLVLEMERKRLIAAGR